MWNNLWSVSRYVMGPLSGRWRQSGNDPQCLAAPIWKYRSGLGDHRFNFFIDLRSNYTFYTNLINIIHWVVAYRDVAHLVRLNLGKSWAKSAKSFDAGLSNPVDHESSGSDTIYIYIGKSRQSIEILNYIMDVLHTFATAKTGDSHMNRLQSIQCLIVSGLGGTVIVGGRCNTRIVRLAIRKIAITFLIFRRSLPNFSQTWAMFRCNIYVILRKI